MRILGDNPLCEIQQRVLNTLRLWGTTCSSFTTRLVDVFFPWSQVMFILPEVWFQHQPRGSFNPLRVIFWYYSKRRCESRGEQNKVQAAWPHPIENGLNSSDLTVTLLEWMLLDSGELSWIYPKNTPNFSGSMNHCHLPRSRYVVNWSYRCRFCHLGRLSDSISGFPFSWGYPNRWMVDFMENPIVR